MAAPDTILASTACATGTRAAKARSSVQPRVRERRNEGNSGRRLTVCRAVPAESGRSAAQSPIRRISGSEAAVRAKVGRPNRVARRRRCGDDACRASSDAVNAREPFGARGRAGAGNPSRRGTRYALAYLFPLEAAPFARRPPTSFHCRRARAWGSLGPEVRPCGHTAAANRPQRRARTAEGHCRTRSIRFQRRHRKESFIWVCRM